MKKALSLIIALLMLAALGFSAFADDILADSIENKLSPEIGVVEVSDGKGGSKACEALIVTTENPDDIIQGVPGKNQRSSGDELIFYVTSVAERDEAVIPEITQALVSAQNQVQAVSNVSQLGGGNVSGKINEAIQAFNEETSANITTGDLVVSDIFDASLVLNDEVLQRLEAGESCAFMIKPAFSRGDFFVLLHNTEGTTWEVVENVEWVTVNGEDFLKVHVDHLSAFALAVEKNAELTVDPQGPSAPQTDIGTGYRFLYVGIAALCLCAAVFFFVKSGKKSKTE